MINFRYHIVSLMAVFLALAVGIVLGVTLVGGEANKVVAAQAEQDRKQVQDYRQQLQQQQALNNYRDAYAQRVRGVLTDNMLTGINVAVVAMPGAPSRTVSDLQTAVNQAGGVVTSTSSVSANVFDETKDSDTIEVVDEFKDAFPAQASVAQKVGTVLGRAVSNTQTQNTDQTAQRMRDALGSGRLVQIDSTSNLQAQAVIVVTAEASDPSPSVAQLVEHVGFDSALSTAGQAFVLAGPNSAGIDGTDVAQARQEPTSREKLTTVDVADLPSGVTTVIMALKAESLGRPQGHYGAASSAEAPTPELPIR